MVIGISSRTSFHAWEAVLAACLLPHFSWRIRYQTLVDHSSLSLKALVETQAFYLQSVDPFWCYGNFDILTTLASFFRFQKLSSFKGTTMYGFLQRAISITVSHMLGMKMEELFFACCMHRVTFYFYVAKIKKFQCWTLCSWHTEKQKRWTYSCFGRCRYQRIGLIDGDSDQKCIMRHVPISQAEQPPSDSSHT